MRVGIVGLGLIGGSLALDLRACGVAAELVGVDTSEAHARQAVELGLVDRSAALYEALTEADLVILAIPVDATARLLPAVLDRIGPRTIVTDMGSTKEQICRAVLGHPKRRQFVAAHPMAGTENSGPSAALVGLFDGRTAVICDRDESDPAAVAKIEELFRAIGMRLTYMAAREHDLHAAYVSHLSHISSFVLATTVLDIEKNVSSIFDLAGGGFASTVRLGKSSPEMWKPIFEQNRDHVLVALSAYIEQLQRFRECLAEGRFEETRELMESANRIRRVLDSMKSPRQSGR